MIDFRKHDLLLLNPYEQFDMHGRLVKVLVKGSKDAGQHTVHLDAASLAKGIYFYKLKAGNFTDVKKLIIW